MGQAARVLVLLPNLFMALVYAGPGPRFRPRRAGPSRIIGEPFAVLFGSQVLPTPMALVLVRERAQLSGSLWRVLAVAAAPVVAYGLVRLLSPPWLKRRHLLMALRAGFLVVAVVGVELFSLTLGVPVLSKVGPISAIALLVSTGYLGCCRLIDYGYFPILLLRDAGWFVFLAAVTGWWALDRGGTLALLRPGSGLGQFVFALLWWGVAAIGTTGMVAGVVRLVRWLRLGSPPRPAPPGVVNWPPVAGEVWNAEVTHNDDNYKDRPVLVWESTPTHVRALAITTVDKSGRPDQYVRLPLSQWDGVLTKEAWLSLEITPVPYVDFRSLRGDCRESVWHQLGSRYLVREPSANDEPAPGFARRHRFFSAMNRRVGKDARTLPADIGGRRSRDRNRRGAKASARG